MDQQRSKLWFDGRVALDISVGGISLGFVKKKSPDALNCPPNVSCDCFQPPEEAIRPRLLDEGGVEVHVLPTYPRIPIHGRERDAKWCRFDRLRIVKKSNNRNRHRPSVVTKRARDILLSGGSILRQMTGTRLWKPIKLSRIGGWQSYSKPHEYVCVCVCVCVWWQRRKPDLHKCRSVYVRN